MKNDYITANMIGGEGEASRLGDVTSLKVVLALMLVVTHGLTALHGVESSATHLAPAVPVFMFLSGYFMMSSYKGSPYPLRFFINRYLKLFPIMVASLVAASGLLVLYSGWPVPAEVVAEFPQFMLAHLTVFQNFVPTGYRALDGEVANGSLWFIEAILILYATLPVIAWLERRLPGLLVVLCALSAAGGVLFYAYAESVGGLRSLATALSIPPSDTLHPLVEHVILIAMRVTFSAWMFYAGCLARRYQKWLFTPGIAGLMIAISLATTLVLYFLDLGRRNHFGSTPPWYYPGYLAAWIILHKQLLLKLEMPPISIGLYVWHNPVFHALIFLDMAQLWIAVPLVVLIAWASLHVIERPVANLISRVNLGSPRPNPDMAPPPP